jgi:hypothetical protein
MIRARALGLLATCADLGGLDLDRAALRRVDPMLRRWVRRRVEAAFLAAERADPRAKNAHRARLAYLIEGAGAPTSDPTDEVAILAEYTTERGALARPSSRWWPTWSVVLFALLTASLGVAHAIHGRRFDPSKTPLGASLADAIPEYLVLLDHAAIRPQAVSATTLARARVAAITPGVERALGPTGATQLGRMLDAAASVAALPVESPVMGSWPPRASWTRLCEKGSSPTSSTSTRWPRRCPSAFSRSCSRSTSSEKRRSPPMLGPSACSGHGGSIT